MLLFLKEIEVNESVCASTKLANINQWTVSDVMELSLHLVGYLCTRTFIFGIFNTRC